MKEHPILFSSPEVRAILDGTKTQTRRVVRARWMQHVQFTGAGDDDRNDPRHWGFEDDDGEWWALQGDRAMGSETLPSPYGQPGDRLWVRETWQHYFGPPAERCYKATGHDPLCPASKAGNPDLHLWRPSIHMPRWACRLVLEVVSVRVERLQAISEPWDDNPWAWVVEFRRAS